MLNPSPAFAAALAGAREGGLVPRSFVFITAKDRASGNPVSVGLSSMDDDLTLSVLSGASGANVSRAYVGVGRTLIVPELIMTTDLTVQGFTIDLPALASVVQDLVRGYDVRLAQVDIHQGLLSTTTRKLVAAPELVFIGEVDGAPVETPAAGGDAKVSLEIVSSAVRMLTRTNPSKRSYEGQKRRNGDEFARHSNRVGMWDVNWGQTKTTGAANSTPKQTGDGRSHGILAPKS